MPSSAAKTTALKTRAASKVLVDALAALAMEDVLFDLD